MGNDHGFSSEYNFFKKDHKEISQIQNQWGNSVLLQSKFSQHHRCIEKILRFSNDQDYQNYRQTFKSFQNFKSSNFAKILTFSEGNEGFCANPGLTLAIILEYPQPSLQDIILKQNEIQQGELKFLEQDDFLTIMHQLLDLFYSMHLFDLPLGQISPDNIFITEDGDIKYINSYLLTARKSSLDYQNFDQHLITTYSPEEFLILKFKTHETIYDIDDEKVSIFSFGITLLSLLSSQNYKVFYDYEDCNIKFDKITKILSLLEEYQQKCQVENLMKDQHLVKQKIDQTK